MNQVVLRRCVPDSDALWRDRRLQGVRANGVAPGAIPGGGFKADVSTLEKRIAMGRTGTPDDLAVPILTLLSDRLSAYVTGTTLAVDGGLALYNWIDRPVD